MSILIPVAKSHRSVVAVKGRVHSIPGSFRLRPIKIHIDIASPLIVANIADLCPIQGKNIAIVNSASSGPPITPLIDWHASRTPTQVCYPKWTKFWFLVEITMTPFFRFSVQDNGQGLHVFHIIFRSSWSPSNSLNLRRITFSKCPANLILRLCQVWFQLEFQF